MPRLRTACLLFLVAALIIPIGWNALIGRENQPVKPTDFPKLDAAKNPITLQLQADDRIVYGWVSGTESFAGKTVRLKLGDTTETVKVAADNTFAWKFEVKKPVSVDVSLEKLKASFPLSPPAAKAGPSAFFVVDRTAYRPGQTLQFAAFLRMEWNGEFLPVADTPVEVVLTSQQKNLTAARLNLRSDDFGRIVGNYTFTDADTLDEYTLQIPNYTGTANVLLAEYRKSKVRLKITGTPRDGQMKLKFEVLDFLDKPMAVQAGSFVSQVVRRNAPKATATLKAEDFIHHERRAIPRLDYGDLSEEDLLFHEAESVDGLTFSMLGNEVIDEQRHDLNRSGEQLADASLDLKPDWLKGGYDLVVEGVVADANGREQRATETIPIAAKRDDAKKPLELKLARTRFFLRDAIEVRAAGTLFEKQAQPAATLLVMKLAYQTPSTPFFAKASPEDAPSGKLRAFGTGEPEKAVDAKHEIIRRTLVTAVPFAADAAKLTLTEPGAYKLVAVVPNADGTATQAERTILVKRLEDVNPLVLRLDKTEYATGQRLTGTIASRYADARALLTLRDGRGIVFAKPIAFRDGAYRIDEELPPGLRYGCTLDVAYPDDGGTTRLAHAAARVVPTDRLLNVTVTAPDQVAPGATVKLDVNVNRKEAVDLIVSVYDRSLLAIKPDTGRDIRNFYHADDRAAKRLDRELLKRRLGDVRLNTLLEKVKAMQSNKNLPRNERGEFDRLIVGYEQNTQIDMAGLLTLLRLAGLDVYCSQRADEQQWTWTQLDPPDEQNPRLIDWLLERKGNLWLDCHFVGNTLLIQEGWSELFPEYAAQNWHPVFGRNHRAGFHNQFDLFPYMRQSGFGGRNLGGGFVGGFGGGGFGGGAANNLGAGGGLAGIGGSPHAHTPIDASLAPAIAAAPDAPQDFAQLPDLAAGVAIRRNFADTAYWNANVRTDATGHAHVSFKLPDTLTSWQVVVTAVSRKQHVGGATAQIRTFMPVMVWPMLPRTFTEGDAVRVFANVHNRTAAAQTMTVRLKADNGEIRTPAEQTVEIGPKANAAVSWTFAPRTAGEANLLMTAECAAGSDASLKRIPVTRCAAEQIVSQSGFVRDKVSFDIPQADDGQLEVTFAPSLVADLSDTLGYLVEYPYGCVEQTMSRFLPAIKVAQILKQFKVPNADLEKKLPGVAAAGIKRLLELQHADGSWGWLGTTGTHELMTPYALYGLLQAKAAGYTVDADALARGGDRLEKMIAGMGDVHVSDRMYCMYVHSQRKKLDVGWWDWIEARMKAKALSDIALAFAVEMAIREEKPPLAKQFVEALRARATLENGTAYWQTAKFSRWGDDRFEITAAVLKALVAFDKDDPLIEKVLAFFVSTKRGNRWNSTKDTAMVLFAMCDYLAKTQFAESKANTLRLTVGGQTHDVTFENQLAKKVVIPASKLKPGKTELGMATEMKGVMYRAVFRYWKAGRNIAPAAHGLTVERRFALVDDKGKVLKELKSGDAVPRGSFVLSEVVAKRAVAGDMRYLLIENVKPSGCETVAKEDKRFEAVLEGHCDLREDRDAMVCFHHEHAVQAVVDRCVFLAELAGEFVAPPAVAELMYHPETRGHSGTFVLKVE